MERIPYGKFTNEFRKEAVKLVTEGGLSVLAAAKRLSLSSSTLTNWIKALKAGKLGDVGKTHRVLSDREMEIAHLKRELAIAKAECDILKKAAAYFAKESQRGMR